MAEQSSKGFSFFVNSSPEKITEAHNPSLEFIVTQNDFFHKENSALKCKIQELVRERDEYEEENERFEKRIVALRGITFNECEMSKLLEYTIKGYKKTIECHKDTQKEYIKGLNNNFIGVNIFFIINYLLGIPFVLFYVMGITIIAYNTHLTKTINEKSNKIVLDSICLDKEKEYRELRKNQDYITTMIENM